jgi:hypothetical protein
MVELTVGYEGEDESNSKNKYDDAVAKDEIVNHFKEGIDKLDEIARKNYASVGAEHAQICGNGDVPSNIAKYLHKIEGDLCENVINWTSGKLKRGYYRALNMLGLFNPGKVIQKKISTLSEHEKSLDAVCNKYNHEINDIETKIQDKTFMLNAAMKIQDDINAKMQAENKEPYAALQLERNLATVNENFNKAYDDMEFLKQKLDRYDGTVKSLKSLKQQNKWMMQQFQQLLDNSASDNPVLKSMKKLGEAYGKI